MARNHLNHKVSYEEYNGTNISNDLEEIRIQTRSSNTLENRLHNTINQNSSSSSNDNDLYFFDNDSNDICQNTNNANTFFDINDDDDEILIYERIGANTLGNTNETSVELNEFPLATPPRNADLNESSSTSQSPRIRLNLSQPRFILELNSN